MQPLCFGLWHYIEDTGLEMRGGGLGLSPGSELHGETEFQFKM